MKFKASFYKIHTDNYFIRNTEQHQLFNMNKFTRKDNHSIIIEVLLCDLARKGLQ